MKLKSVGLIILLFLVCFSSVLLLSAAGGRVEKQNTDIDGYAESTKSEIPESIKIPTVDDIKANGYPTNENGETYGPDVWESTDPPPDLILVIADDGQEGYIRKTEVDDGVTTLEEAANYNPGRRIVNVYLHDGTTIIGTFTLGGD